MKDRNHIIYYRTIAVVIVVYLVIYLFGLVVKKDIYAETEGYEHNVPQQPVNNILSSHYENKDDDKNSSKNNDGHSENQNDDKNDNKILFSYDYAKGNYIELYNQFPTKDEVGMSFEGNKYTHDFKLKLNPHANGVSYTITLRKQDGSDLEDKWAKVYLTADGVGLSNCFRDNGRIKTFNEYLNYQDDPDEKILYQGVITYEEAKRGYKNFTLRMWISEDLKVYNEAYLQKYFKTQVTVYANK